MGRINSFCPSSSTSPFNSGETPPADPPILPAAPQPLTGQQESKENGLSFVHEGPEEQGLASPMTIDYSHCTDCHDTQREHTTSTSNHSKQRSTQSCWGIAGKEDVRQSRHHASRAATQPALGLTSSLTLCASS